MTDAIQELNELLRKHDEILEQIEEKRKSRRAELLEIYNEVVKEMKELQMDIPDQTRKPLETTKNKRSFGKVEPKYRCLENADLTWTGRGIAPKWFQEALAEGASKESMLIS